MTRIFRTAALLVGATASCYLGMLASRLLWDAPQLLLALLTDAELAEVYRRPAYGAVLWLSFLPPSGGSAWVSAIYAGGSALVACLLLLLGPAALPRLKGWVRLTAAFAIFWLGCLLGDSALAFASRGWGSFAGAMRVLAIGDLFGSWSRWPLALSAWALVVWALYRAAREVGSGAVHSRPGHLRGLALWFGGPIALLSVGLPGIEAQAFWLRRMGFLYAPVVVALLVVALVIWKPLRASPGGPLQAGLAGATWTTSCSVAALALTVGFPNLTSWVQHPDFETRSFRHWQVQFEKGALDTDEQQRWGEAADRRFEALATRLHLALDASPSQAFVYASTKNKRIATGDAGEDSAFFLDVERRAIHHLLPPAGDIADPRGEALLLLAEAWGKPGSANVAEAVARYTAGRFHNHDLGAYGRRIACEEGTHPLREVLGLDSRYLSPLVQDAMGGAWVASLAEQRGDGVVRKLYETPLAAGGEKDFASRLDTTWEQLEQQWQAYLQQEPCDVPAPMERSAPPPDPQLGISFSHEYGGDWGYGSDGAQRELEIIRRVGANTVAVVPYAFTRAPESTWLRFRTDETDARVIRTIEQARRLGMAAMLKPHLWTGRFTGEIAFPNQDDFEIWFSQYRRWLLHFARMAALYDVELLAIGNELGGVTVHEQDWRQLIRDIRRIYSGRLTYAAHWDEEFERIRFWNELDYIGVNFYFPLAERGETPRADSDRVKRIAASLEAVSQKFDRPVLFTEVGFPSVATAASEPWAETGARLDLEAQRRCYEVVREAFQGKPWLAGLYWWKWPTHGRGGPYDPTYQPIGKPALEEIERWYHDAGPPS